MNFKRPAGRSAVKYAQALWKKALRCGLVCDEYSLKGTFIEGPRQSPRQSVRNYWEKDKSTLLQNLARNALSRANLQSGNETPESGQSRALQTNTGNRNAHNIMVVYSALMFESMFYGFNEGTFTAHKLLAIS